MLLSIMSRFGKKLSSVFLIHRDDACAAKPKVVLQRNPCAIDLALPGLAAQLQREFVALGQPGGAEVDEFGGGGGLDYADGGASFPTTVAEWHANNEPEEINITGRETFLAAGGESLTLIPCLNAAAVWIEALAGMCQDALQP